MKKTCFVIIGFGIKTDFETGRRLNLDRTFENIIKPVFDDLDILCYRASDLEQSGVIDKKMYENILKADFVVADISTLNPNAIYELGVRHALKPNTTIVIAEDKLKIPFDINHVFIHSYKHLEEDIGVTEAERFKAHLKKQVEKFIKAPEIDSPIYTFMPNLIPPSFTEDEIEDIKESIDKSHSTSDLVELAEKKKNEKKYEVAKDLLKDALINKPNDSFIIQRLALITYKSKEPSELDALNEALEYLDKLNPKETTDPETLGLLGAINKRLFEQTNFENHIDKSRHYYERGYYVKQDYYNGINVAFLYLLKASLSKTKFDIYANYGQTIKIWNEIIIKWSQVVESDIFEDRGDKEWVCFTLAEAHFGINNSKEEDKYCEMGKLYMEGDFALNSYLEQKEKLKSLLLLLNDQL
ncbi:TRAFs-binding domain-containing protein [Aquimarina sp. AU119]|uniref:TRAFs-binding domain-containing protein n=1 Tax=Aquimarina sp. AU119 TaxID=2108528 RepID=UPI000D697761|nr:TRAFs-binding domain-containing protein [Aquimarina sp. AU119]